MELLDALVVALLPRNSHDSIHSHRHEAVVDLYVFEQQRQMDGLYPRSAMCQFRSWQWNRLQHRFYHETSATNRGLQVIHSRASISSTSLIAEIVLLGGACS